VLVRVLMVKVNVNGDGAIVGGDHDHGRVAVVVIKINVEVKQMMAKPRRSGCYHQEKPSCIITSQLQYENKSINHNQPHLHLSYFFLIKKCGFVPFKVRAELELPELDLHFSKKKMRWQGKKMQAPFFYFNPSPSFFVSGIFSSSSIDQLD
jgi:hypothetical protein